MRHQVRTFPVPGHNDDTCYVVTGQREDDQEAQNNQSNDSIYIRYSCKRPNGNCYHFLFHNTNKTEFIYKMLHNSYLISTRFLCHSGRTRIRSCGSQENLHHCHLHISEVKPQHKICIVNHAPMCLTFACLVLHWNYEEIYRHFQ